MSILDQPKNLRLVVDICDCVYRHNIIIFTQFHQIVSAPVASNKKPIVSYESVKADLDEQRPCQPSEQRTLPFNTITVIHKK